MATGSISPFSAPDEVEEVLSAPGAVTCRAARSPWELELHHSIRHEVFVTEQAFFEGSDRDEHDHDAATIHVVALYGSIIGGAVRLYPLNRPDEWKGDRLAVLSAFRSHGLGAPLVRHAVATAGALGGTTMVATIQMQNVRFFERLGWYRTGEPDLYFEVPHQSMEIDLQASYEG